MATVNYKNKDTSLLEGSIVDSLTLTRESNRLAGYGSLDSPSDSYSSENYPVQSVFTFPVYAQCPNCHRRVLTHVEYKSGRITLIFTILLCLLGLWCCIFLPLCISACKDVVHVCPDCHSRIGTYKRWKN
uniref:LITAF domain-containing protein n=1 Tax=Amphimedon queenslandica TaxID=400682 RepID=A0A1X7VNN9_AMPQE